jgi:hypothetical protein
MEKAGDLLIRKLKENGIYAALMSVEGIDKIRESVVRTREENKDIDQALAGYFAEFDFDIQNKFPEASSVLAVAMPQPIVKVAFTWAR